jgi:glycosyltransferase involved in cell wall biosynthesis
VGAFDRITGDPLRKYIDKCGWRGVLVEPQAIDWITFDDLLGRLPSSLNSIYPLAGRSCARFLNLSSETQASKQIPLKTLVVIAKHFAVLDSPSCNGMRSMLTEPVALSVVICTFNPRPEYFDRCLKALETQTVSVDKWELLLVDNASDSGKAPRPDLSWHPRARLVCEPRPGLTPARLRGIRETMGGLLVFVDDDNVLDSDFLGTALHVSKEKPFLGSWSGQCRAAFENQPPEWTRRYWGSLVIREFDKDVWSNLHRLPQSMPCGAGLCVRRDVALRYLDLHESGKRSFQFDRTGDSLLSGGDNDLAACACDIGLGVGLIASLKLTHLVPPERLTVDYLERLAEGIHYSSTLLDSEHGIHTGQRTALGRTADFLRIMRLEQPHRRILRAAFRGRDRALQQLSRANICRTQEKN